MTPLECCEIGTTYGDTGARDLRSLERAARLHAEMQMSQVDLDRELRQRPDIVDGWLRWSEDKRWSPAWYFYEVDGHCIVGYFSDDDSECRSSKFEDRYQACAAFIIHELEDYRSLREEKGKW